MSSARWLGFGACVAPFGAALGYEALVMMRPWSEREIRTSEGDVFTIRALRRPPPTGLVLYPAGRVLLEWCSGMDAPAAVIELGSGTGQFAIGSRRRWPSTRVVATDKDQGALENLRRNAARAGVDVETRELDVDAGELADLFAGSFRGPVLLAAADLSYRGGAAADAFANALADALRRRPDVVCRLVVVDRFSGGAFAALAGQAGVDAAGGDRAPDARLVSALTRRGLTTLVLNDADRAILRARVSATLDPPQRLSWLLLGTFDQMRCIEVHGGGAFSRSDSDVDQGRSLGSTYSPQLHHSSSPTDKEEEESSSR